MQTIAILGASGFIGSRAVEMLHLGGVADVRPIVRTAARLAPLSRFDLDARIADARHQEALEAAFSGCDVVVHTVAGSCELIRSVIEPVYCAACRAGVGRLIYLSSASVHGQAPLPGTDEETALPRRHALPYNGAKAGAEQMLLRLRKKGDVEVVVLRPGIVYGPRSSWIGGFADTLLRGEAYLIDGGRGACNAIYVDNLIHGICTAGAASAVDGEAFFLGDREQVTWADLYAPIAHALGFELDQIESVAPIESPTWLERVLALRRTRRVRSLGAFLPVRLRRRLSAEIAARSPGPSTGSNRRMLRPTLEMSLLQTGRYWLPYEKAKRVLGYDPPVSFAEGCRNTIGWMDFAGYPVVDHSVLFTLHGDRTRSGNLHE